MRQLVPFTTSWDDGAPTDIEVAQLLDEYDFRGTFYASTGPSGRRGLSDGELLKVGSLQELGIHGQTHGLFTEMASGAIADEILWGAQSLASFGSVASIVAPPNGRMNRDVVRVIHDLGFQVRSAPILATRDRRVGWMEPSFQLYPHGWIGVLRNSARRRMVPAVPLLRGWAKGGDFRERSIRLLRASIDALPVVHIWGHSSELEHLQLWSVLEELLVDARRLGVRPCTNSELEELRP